MKKNHLTEKDLIEYQFKLASQEQIAEAAEHLKECEKCRQLNERLAAKFSSLELLREEPQLNEELVSRVLESIKTSRQTKLKLKTFKIPAWIGAAAAVLLVASLLVVSEIKEQRRSKLIEGLRTDEPKSTEKYAYDSRETATERESEIRGESEELGRRLIAGDRIVSRQEDEEPPFAPASAIELVTLPRRESVQTTIYNSADLTLVRERRNLTLKKGWNWLQFMWANTLIDPTSLNLEPLEEKEKIEIEQLVFPPRLKEVGRWLIHSEVEGQVPFEITYFTSGLSWRAFYMGTLTEDEKTMRLEGYVRVTNNSGEDYENAQTRLIVGTVHMLDEIAELARRQWPYGRPGELLPLSSHEKEELSQMRGVAVQQYYSLSITKDELRQKVITKEGLSEYFLYTIEGIETIETGWSKRLVSFTADDVPVVNLYKYEQQRYGNSVIRFLSFKNDEKHKLGETPIPGGTLKVYRSVDDAGHLSYTGQSAFKYIPIDEEVELNLGPVENVVVEPILMEFSTENFKFDSKGNIAGWDEVRTYNIEVRNTRDIPVKVEIKRNFASQYWDITKKGDFDSFEKEDLDTVKFTVELKPETKKEFEYTLRTYHGIRQQDWNN